MRAMRKASKLYILPGSTAFLLVTAASFGQDRQSSDLADVIRRYSSPSRVTHKETRSGALAARLEALGATPTDLHPFLEEPGALRTGALNILNIMASFQTLDAATLSLLERLIADIPANEGTITRLLLRKSPKPAAQDAALRIVDKVFAFGLSNIMYWIRAQDRSSVRADSDIQKLIGRCFDRLRELCEAAPPEFQTGPAQIYRHLQHPPFNDPAYTKVIAQSYLAVAARPSRFDVFSRSHAYFALVRRVAPERPNLVEDGLRKVIAEGSRTTVKFMLWQIVIKGMVDSDMGPRLVEAALKRFLDLAPFYDLLAIRLPPE